MTLLAVLLAIFGGLQATIRLAPFDANQQSIIPALAVWSDGGPWDEVVALGNGAALRLSRAKGAPQDILGKLDAVATATPRTKPISGAVTQGRITWETRSLFWGFPDYTTAETRPDGLYIYARQRYGTSDFGVNAARLKGWLGQL